MLVFIPRQYWDNSHHLLVITVKTIFILDFCLVGKYLQCQDHGKYLNFPTVSVVMQKLVWYVTLPLQKIVTLWKQTFLSKRFFSVGPWLARHHIADLNKFSPSVYKNKSVWPGLWRSREVSFILLRFRFFRVSGECFICPPPLVESIIHGCLPSTNLAMIVISVSAFPALSFSACTARSEQAHTDCPYRDVHILQHCPRPPYTPRLLLSHLD